MAATNPDRYTEPQRDQDWHVAEFFDDLAAQHNRLACCYGIHAERLRSWSRAKSGKTKGDTLIHQSIAPARPSR